MSIETDAIEAMSHKELNGKAAVIEEFLKERQHDIYCTYNKRGILVSYRTGLVFFKRNGMIKLVLNIYEVQGTMIKDAVCAVYGHETLHMVNLFNYTFKKQYTR